MVCVLFVAPVVRSGGEKIEGLRGKEALVQAVVKNIARKEVKEPETRSDDEVRAELRAKGEQVVKVRQQRVEPVVVVTSCVY